MVNSTPSQTERDTIEVIAYLKKEDVLKEDEIDQLKKMVKDSKTEAHREKDELEEAYSQEIAQLEASLSEKDEEVRCASRVLSLIWTLMSPPPL